MTEKPFWKDFIDRSVVKAEIERGFDKMVGDADFEVELGKLTSRLERYLVLRFLENCIEYMKTIRKDADDAISTLEDFKKQLVRQRIKETAERRHEDGVAETEPEGETEEE